MRETLSIWYLSPLRRCNFKCAYCSTEQPLITDNNEWNREDSQATHQAVMKWMSELPYQLRIRMNSTGEPFVSKSYLATIARMTHAENVEFLEVLTNGSFSKSQFEKFALEANVKKLSLWMTYHHTQIAVEKFIEAAVIARDHGVSVVVHALLFPDSTAQVAQLRDLCQLHSLKLHVGLGINFNGAYDGKGFIPVVEQEVSPELMDLNVAFPSKVYTLAKKPSGWQCSAGHQYIFINPLGEIHQCATYSDFTPEKRLGSVMDAGFKLKLRADRYAECQSKAQCVCVEDYQHLELAEKHLRITHPSFIASSKAEILKV